MENKDKTMRTDTRELVRKLESQSTSCTGINYFLYNPSWYLFFLGSIGNDVTPFLIVSGGFS